MPKRQSATIKNYKQSEYGRVILPLTVIRRLDCVLEPRAKVTADGRA